MTAQPAKGRLPTLHDTGHGPAVLLLHAAPLDASQWDHQVAALSDRYRCLRPDFWGCGRSPPPPPDSGLERYAASVLQLLEGCGVRSFAMVGLSLGGYVAMALLRLAPERIRTVVLADTRATADTDSTATERSADAARARAEGVEFLVEPSVARLLAPMSRQDLHITEPLKGRVRGYSGEGMAAQMDAIRDRPDSTGLLASIGIPTLVVGGDQDALTPPASMLALAASIPGAEHAVIDDSGHLSNLENPTQFTARVAEFLARHHGPTAVE
ncbi:MAG: alpha/beta fold hydrolase [Candidatus Dormibacteria bacterium]